MIKLTKYPTIGESTTTANGEAPTMTPTYRDPTPKFAAYI